MKTLNNFEVLSETPFQNACCGIQEAACDLEKKYRNPLQTFLNFSPSSPAYRTIYRIIKRVALLLS
jgi:hypothetical protein